MPYSYSLIQVGTPSGKSVSLVPFHHLLLKDLHIFYSYQAYFHPASCNGIFYPINTCTCWDLKN